MSRPHLPLGTSGVITSYRTPAGYRARAKYRDYDGITRRIERHAATKGKAETSLREALRDRMRTGGSESISPDSRVSALADAWFTDLQEQGRSPGTLHGYRERLDNQVIPALGNLLVRELRTGVIEHHLKAIGRKHGSATAKQVRTVLSGMCGYAARHDALAIANPVREASRISAKVKRPPRSLDIQQIRQLRALMTYDDQAIARDIPDLVDVLLATGLRVGEAIGLFDAAFDPLEGSVEVRGTVVRVTGVGLFFKPEPKSVAGHRRLLLPSWGVTLMTRRFSASPVTEVPVLDRTTERGVDQHIERHRLLFPSLRQTLRDPSNVDNQLKDAFVRAGEDITSHVFRKTVATLMDDAGLSARHAADQLGHSRVSMTQDTYFGRKASSTGAATILESIVDQSERAKSHL
jgi:integrase